YEAEKQIILTSDRPPHSIRTLEDRLRNRFEWGLIADVQPPSSELRQAIIRKKAEVRGITLSDDIVIYLAENLKTNIRQIEGSIKKIAALSSLTHTPISLDISKRAIADILSGEEPVSITVDKICAVVSKKYDIPAEDIKGKKRNKEIAKARHVSIYLIKQFTSLPLTSIGALMGNRDHATILFSFNKIREDMKTDKQLALELEDMIREIKK
ncbi:MAG: chromosomal replication initiator protein DnaA, partial [Clostridia bacterium]|nr:chromosomal replication initiator protein DnaA [Clostridia bacterium]